MNWCSMITNNTMMKDRAISSSWLLCGMITLTMLLDMTMGFNLDLMSPIIHTGPMDSDFGFSVELHREQNIDW